MTESQAGAVKSQDEDLQEVQEILERVMGPLGVAFTTLELFNNEAPDVEFDPFLMGQQIQKAVQLVGQAVEKLSYQRRLRILSSLGTVKEAKKVLHDPRTREMFSEEESDKLFTDYFEEKELTATRNVIKYLNPTPAKKEPKGGASNGGNRGGAHGGGSRGSHRPFLGGPSRNGRGGSIQP